jgi:hypothetical protein
MVASWFWALGFEAGWKLKPQVVAVLQHAVQPLPLRVCMSEQRRFGLRRFQIVWGIQWNATRRLIRVLPTSDGKSTLSAATSASARFAP